MSTATGNTASHTMPQSLGADMLRDRLMAAATYAEGYEAGPVAAPALGPIVAGSAAEAFTRRTRRPAEVHDLAARRAQHNVGIKPTARKRRVALSWRAPLEWLARLAPTARLTSDICALLLAYKLTLGTFLPTFPIALVFATFLPILGLLRLYAPPQGVHCGSLIKELPGLTAGCAAAATLMAIVMGHSLGLGDAAYTAFLTLVALVLCRGFLHVVASLLRRHGYAVRKTLIVGSGHTVDVIASKIAKRPELGLRVVGIMSGNSTGEHGRHTIAERPGDLPAVVKRLGIEQLILVPAAESTAESTAAGTRFVSDCFMAVDGLKVQASLVPPMQDFLLSPSNIEQIEGIPLISLGRLSYAPRMMPGKRILDLLCAGILLLLVSPILLMIAVAIKIEDRGPVLFRQKRAGYRGLYFEMMKFRSMHVDAEAHVAALSDSNETDGLLFKIKDDPRITRVGKFIRRTSLDELPQLVNVLKGHMSLVGPRALPVEIEHFGDIAIKRLNVRPGVTGYWQVLGRSDLSYDEMVKLDLAYIQNWSLWVDVQLLLKTIPALFVRRGAY